MAKLSYNKVCEIEDFSDPEVLQTLTDIRGYIPNNYFQSIHRKWWEVAMSVRALDRLGVIQPDATILGVGAGTEITSFYLANHVRQVFATDLYLYPQEWEAYAPTMMLVDPTQYAEIPFHNERLVVQHMDGRILRYPDNFFDGIYSSGSIEHFGSLDFVANAAYEMGRVLKPGGILTLSTEFKINGPVGDGWGIGTLILSRERIQHYIIEACGLEPVGDIDYSISADTLATQQNLGDLIAGRVKQSETHIVLDLEGYVFGSIHLTLRKSASYPVTDNQWAKPSAVTEQAVAELNQQLRASLSKKAPEAQPALAPASPVLPAETTQHLDELLRTWQKYYFQARDNPFAQRLPWPLNSIYRTLIRLNMLGKAWDAQNELYQTLVDIHRQK